MNCVVIDDEPLARELLTTFIAKIPELKLEGAFSSALLARDVLRKKNIDVLFLDIQMPDINGLDFLKTLDKRPQVILTTAFAEYALEGFNLDVADYLLKPFDFNRFLKAVNKISKSSTQHVGAAEDSSSSQEFLFLKDGSKLIRAAFADILYIKGMREYVTAVCKQKKITSLQSLSTLEKELPAEFVRIHNSYIVNVAALDVIYKNKVQIGEEFLPVGVTYKKHFFQVINRFLPGKSIIDE